MGEVLTTYHNIEVPASPDPYRLVADLKKMGISIGVALNALQAPVSPDADTAGAYLINGVRFPSAESTGALAGAAGAWVQSRATAAGDAAKTHANNGDATTLASALSYTDTTATEVRSDAYAYTDASFAAAAPGGATDDAVDAAVDRAVLANRVAGPEDLPANGARALGHDELIHMATAHGVVLDGTTDNYAALAALLNLARSTKRAIYIPAGTCYVNGSLDVSGVRIFGDAAGYYERAGTIIRGNGTDVVFDQKQTNLDNISYGLHKLKITNAGTGVRMSYAIYCHLSDVTIESSGPGLVVGVAGIIGPIWNVFDRVKVKSTGGPALVLGGKDWCNSNVFNVCDFNGDPAVRVETSGGYGAVANVFKETEIRGPNIGFHLVGLSNSLKIESCYIEPHGPSVVIAAATRDLRLSYNIYGSTRASNTYGKPHYVHHETGTATVRVDGGWLVTNGGTEFSNMRFVGSDAPSSLTLQYVTEPHTSMPGAGFLLHDPAVINVPKTHRGNLTVQQHATPGVTIQYPDGSKPFTVRRNGTQGGADYGVQFRTGSTNAFTVLDSGYTLFNSDVSFSNTVAGTSLGPVVGGVPVRTTSGSIAGYLPLYGSIT